MKDSIPETSEDSIMHIHTDSGTKTIDRTLFEKIKREVEASELLAKNMQELYDKLASDKTKWYVKLISKIELQLYKWKVLK